MPDRGWTLTGWAKGISRDGQHEQAVRIQMTRPDYVQAEVIEMQAQASGLYRREYGTWATEIGGHADGPGDERRALPPGRRLKDSYQQDIELDEDGEGTTTPAPS